MIIKGSTQKKDITMYNPCSHIRASKYMKQKLTELKKGTENPRCI